TGVLPLVVGRATRLARFLSGSDKSYDAEIRLGWSTDTADAQGAAIGARYAGVMPDRDAVDRALDAFRGTFLQQPPAFSAKKIQGRRSHELARAQAGRDAQGSRAAVASDRSDAADSDDAARRSEPSAGERDAAATREGPPVPAAVAVTAHAIDVVGLR